MPFKKYSSIENSYREKTLSKIKEMDFMKTNNNWIVSEKLHGSCTCVGVEENGDIWFGRRNDILLPDEDFYGYQTIKKSIVQNIKNIKKYFDSIDAVPNSIIVFAELCGGFYNHPDVPKMKVKKVQKGIQYSPNLEFVVFDIMLNGEYINQTLMYEILSKHSNFLYVKTLFEGTLDECLAYPNDFESKLPEQLSLPEIKDNMCEGVVIKPLFDQYLPNGSRVILKNKNKKWSEIGKSKKKKVKISLTTSQDRMLTYLIAYVNENRYNAVVSKMGEIDYSDTSLIGKLIPALRKDVLEDFWKDYGDKFLKDDLKFVNKEFTKEVRDLVLEKF